MKICLIGPGIMKIPPPGWGAVEILIWEYYQELIKYDHEVDIINIIRNNSYEQNSPNTEYSQNLINTINSKEYDFVHLHYDCLYHILPFLKCKNKGITSHYPYIDQKDKHTNDGYSKIFGEICNNNLHNIFTLSKKDYNTFYENSKDTSKIFLLTNGANHKEIISDINGCNKEKSIYIGKIEERKQQFKYCKISNIDFYGKCLDDNFKILDCYKGEFDHNNLMNIMKTYGNLVLLSKGEADPLVIKECMMAGLPIVTNKHSIEGLNFEEIKKYIDIIPDDKLEDLEYIENIIKENLKKQIYKEEIRKYALENFSWNFIIKNYLDIIEKIKDKERSYNPYISIIIPLHHGIEFIEDSVMSVLNQSYKNWELIIGLYGYIEDLNIIKKIKEYEQKSEKIKVFNLNIKDKTECLNKITNLSNYNYIALLDVGDIWENYKLERQIQYLKKYDIIGSKCIYFGELNDISPEIPVGDISNFDFTDINPIINSSVIIKKELCYWNNCILEDYDLWLRLRINNKGFFNFNENLVKLRTSKNNNFNDKDVIKLKEKYKKIFINKYLPNILYINLDHRTDRKENFLNNFQDHNNIIRISGKYEKENGAFGCLQSHIKALEYCKNLGDYVLICEDDFKIIDYSYTLSKLKQIFESKLEWDIILLSQNLIEYNNTEYENIIKIKDAQTTSGYIIKKKYVDTLLSLFKRSLNNYKNTNLWTCNNCVDIIWKELQKNDNWYGFLPSIGFQFESYSDIENRITNYLC